jgi:hypothetical protein
MVGMATIRKEGFIGVPLPLGANILTDAVATGIPSAHREEISWTDRGSHSLHR